MPEKKVYVLIYNDMECGAVACDVFQAKRAAQDQLYKIRAIIEESVQKGQYIITEYGEDGIERFAHRADEDDILYECFIREEMVQ